MITNSVRQFVIESLHGFWNRLRQIGVPHSEVSDLTVSIPFGEVDSTSTSTVFTATVDGITELRDGVCCYIRNDVVDSAANCTLNINGLGAKPIYSNRNDAQRLSTGWTAAKTFLFVYNSSRVTNGCWDMYYGDWVNDNSIAYQIRHNNNGGTLPLSTQLGRYRLVFTSADGTKYVPANSADTAETAIKTPTTEKINPFGEILYYFTYSVQSANSTIDAGWIWNQYQDIKLGFSFNNTGSALTLTAHTPVYLKCAPQSDGGAIIDANEPFTQSLPSTEDGKIYIFLGLANSATTLELLYFHPVYYYKDGAIREWTNAAETDVSGKADKVQNAVSGNFAGLDSNGNLTDSGYDYSDFATSGQGVPSGGTTGQVLAKHSNTDNDVEWVNRIDVVQLSSTSGTLTSSQIDAVISDHCMIIWGGDYYYKNYDDGSNVYYICNYVYENSGYINQREIEISKSTGVYDVVETQSAPATTITFRQW